MKRIEIIMNSKGYAMGCDKGKQDTIEKILKFVDEESKFLPDIHSDALLDRLVKFIKKL